MTPADCYAEAKRLNFPRIRWRPAEYIGPTDARWSHWRDACTRHPERMPHGHLLGVSLALAALHAD